MSAPALLDGLSRITGQYDAILCDVWGVIHDGKRAFVGACGSLQAFRRQGGAVVLITNAPVPKERATRFFAPLGVPMDCFDDVVTSGDATQGMLAGYGRGPVYPIGLADDRSVYSGLDVDFTNNPDSAVVVCCTSLREYPDGLPETYADELKRLHAHGLPMICANPDIVFRYGDRLIWSAGALAKMYEELGGRVIRPGKPDEPIYMLAMQRVEEVLGRRPASDRVLCIGDGPTTDIRGAMNQRMDSVFIGGGIHGHAMTNGDGFLESAARVLAAEGVSARYAMPELVW